VPLFHRIFHEHVENFRVVMRERRKKPPYLGSFFLISEIGY